MKMNQTVITALFASAALFSAVSCDVKKIEDGNVPDVKVEVKGDAKLPKYDVDVPKIEVGTKKVEVEVPTVEVKPANAGTEGPNGEKKDN